MADVLGQTPDPREEVIQRRLQVVQLQSDLAYFQARLGLLGEPKTTNQEAQRRTFKLLHQVLGQQMIQTRNTAPRPPSAG